MTGRLLQTVLRQAEALAADAGPDAVPDAELLARFARLRDEPAFAALVRRHGPMVWAVCRHLLPNPADAEDAFQATFLALVRSAGTVRTATVGAWLHGVAVRAAAKLKRTAARRRQREERAAGPEADRSVPEGAWDGLLAAVHEEVGRLPEALRTAFVLCDLEGVRQPDAAARLGWKPGTLTGRLTKARQRLLARLADRGIAAGAVAVGAAAAGAGVPAALAGKVLGLSTAAADAVPPALWQLTLEVTPMTVNKTKLIAACVLVAGGLGIGVGSALMPGAGAQGPKPKAGNALPPPDAQIPPQNIPSPEGQPGQPDAGRVKPGAPAAEPELGYDAGMMAMGMGMMSGAPAPASQRWEYFFTNKPESLDTFQKILRQHGTKGWEYAGEATYSRQEINKLYGINAASVLVFKRPMRSGSSRGGAGMEMPGATGSPGGPMMPGGPGGSRGDRRSAPTGTGGSPMGGMMPGMPGPGGMLPGGMIPPVQPRGSFQVIPMKHATARQLAETLTRLFPGVTAVADDRTNSLILKADADAVREIKELIQKLDVKAADPAPGPAVGGPGGSLLPTIPN